MKLPRITLTLTLCCAALLLCGCSEFARDASGKAPDQQAIYGDAWGKLANDEALAQKLNEVVGVYASVDNDKLKISFDTFKRKADPNEVEKVLHGKSIAMLYMGGDSDLVDRMISMLPDMELGYLGLDVSYLSDHHAKLREMPFLKALVIDSMPEGVWTHVLALNYDSSLGMFQLELLKERFPNLIELTIRDGAPPIDFTAYEFPASLSRVVIQEPKKWNNKDIDTRYLLANVYNANAAREIPTIEYINHQPAAGYDAIASLSDEEKALYAERLIALWADGQYDSFCELPRLPLYELTLKKGDRVMVSSYGNYGLLKYDGDNELVRGAITSDPQACDYLAVVNSHSSLSYDAVVVGGGRVMNSSTQLYIYDMKNNKVYTEVMYFDPALVATSDDQYARNAIYKEKYVWGFIEPLFKE